MSGMNYALEKNSGPLEWIIDTGDTNHMTSDIKLLNIDSISDSVSSK